MCEQLSASHSNAIDNRDNQGPNAIGGGGFTDCIARTYQSACNEDGLCVWVSLKESCSGAFFWGGERGWNGVFLFPLAHFPFSSLLSRIYFFHNLCLKPLLNTRVVAIDEFRLSVADTSCHLVVACLHLFPALIYTA